MPKREKDYGLPSLTPAEAARVLGVEEGAFMIWVMEAARPSESEWSLWKNRKRDLPETLIRLYLTQRRPEEEGRVSAYHQELRELKELAQETLKEARAAARGRRRSSEDKKRRTA
jgi:hypothetical protein